LKKYSPTIYYNTVYIFKEKKDFKMDLYQNEVANVVELLKEVQIIPVLAIEKVEDGIKVCEILNNCGLKAAEITFRTAAAEEIIREASKQFPELLIGAGTILNVDDLHTAFEAGARFGVAPGFNPTVVKAAVKSGYAFFPGISCPSHVEQAYELGVKVMKFFPAEAAGGLPMLKSIIAPYRHLGIQFMPTGGIKPDNVMNYLEIPEVIGAGGTWLATTAEMSNGDWDKIEEKINAAVKMI
jgi:2-dehydro-3-deoxyphosphogluconate aldolase/(4S)-4-hydroxy-2-oxoglutarate aldolase